jgi:HTH-type transcriptional regulator/antitoxin HigA
LLAEYKAKQISVKPFNKDAQDELIGELNYCFYKNKNTIGKVKTILGNYGIKFFTLDRPSQTPVDGKSFMCGNSPTVVLSLKYSRLDNFAFTLMHEIGHVFLHLTKTKYHDQAFFVNAPNVEKEEREADDFAERNLIPVISWKKFVLENYDFEDDIIEDFSKKVKVHPAIILGRICYENPEYYRKRSAIKAINILT